MGCNSSSLPLKLSPRVFSSSKRDSNQKNIKTSELNTNDTWDRLFDDMDNRNTIVPDDRGRESIMSAEDAMDRDSIVFNQFTGMHEYKQYYV